jgi:RHS repeat-associated protein
LTGRSLLTSIEQFGKDVNAGGSPLPAHTFTYQDDTLGKGFYPISGDPPTPPATLEDVVWTNLVKTGADGNSLMRTTGASAWDAGGASTRALAAGDGYVEVSTYPGVHTVFGLSNGDGDVTPGDIDFALYQNNGTGLVHVWENGVEKAVGGPLVEGEALRVEIQGNKVIYKQGATIIYQATKRLVYPLLVDAAIYSFNGRINDAVLSGSLRYVSHWCGGVLATADVDGDGRTDQICHKEVEGTLQVALAGPSGFAAPTLWASGLGSPNLTFGDFNSDGKSDVATYDKGSGDFKVGLSDGASFSAPTLWGKAEGPAPNPPHPVHTCHTDVHYPYFTIGTGDFNGDGVTDVSCKVAGKGEAYIGLSNGTSGFSFSIFADLSCEPLEVTGAIDFDGDGKDDWYCAGVTTSVLLVFPSTGSSFVFPAFGSLDSSFCSGDYVLGDFNGDGRTDAACGNGGNIALSTGREFEIQPGTFGALCPSGTNVFAADVDADGASEIVCNNANAPANDIEIRKWKAGALAPAETWKASWCSASIHAGDFNGDSKTDLLCSALSAPAVAGTGGYHSDLMASAGNGMGGMSYTTYSSSVNFTNTNNPPPKQVVTMASTSDGRGGTSTTTYSYSGGYMDRQERRFLGFREVTATLPCINGDCPTVVTTLKQDLPSAGKPEKVERRDGTGRVLRKTEYVYATSETPPRTSVLTQEDSSFSDTVGSEKQTRAVHQYDAYGNRLQTILHGDLDQPGDELTSAWTFAYNTSAYIVDRVSSEQQFEGEGTGGLKLTEQHYHYDEQGFGAPPNQGFVTRIESRLDTDARFVGRTLGYDQWGNLELIRDETERPTTIGYDTTHHIYPTSVTNGAGEQETTTWDPVCGTPAERRDANNQPTTFQADNFCRPSLTNTPLGGFEVRTYLNLGNPSTQHVRVETPSATEGDGSGNDYLLEYFDGLGRPYKTVKKGTSAEPTIRKDIAYNARGGVASETTPYYDGSEAVQTTSHTYDSLDRVTRSVFLDNADVEKTYGTWSETAYDEHGDPTTSQFDAYGRKKRTEQLFGIVTTYEHDPLGRMTGMTDDIGITWSWIFDSLGRNTTRNDPDAGSWSFEYDDAGRLIQQTDAKAQQTDFTYDAAGRLATKVNAAGTVTITHSEQRAGYFNLGRLTSVNMPGKTLTMDYDAAGRPVKQERGLDGFLYTAYRRYDSAGRLRGITYPDTDAIGTSEVPIEYDRAGRLFSIPNILTAVEYDGAGRPTSQTAANGLVTTKTYSSRGFLTDIVTAGGAIQDLHYQLDQAGLVDYVTSPFPNEGWDYSYDGLHRLTSAQSFSSPTENQSFGYDSAHRMTYNSKVGTYEYPPVGSPRPHAPSTVNGQAYAYDLNGNLYSGGGRGIAWNADNLVTQVTKGSTTTTFTYDGLGERVKKVSGNATSIYPMGDDYEVTNATITKYVSIPGLGVIAKKVGTTRYWLHTDRLGSIQAITDEAGTVVQHRTYRPYGDKLADTTSHVESRGYIDQRQDGETGLIYLHARYYDAALGLFVSPDPSHPADAGVGLNRYAYGLSNPANGTDRTGLETVIVCDSTGCKFGEEVYVDGKLDPFFPGYFADMMQPMPGMDPDYADRWPASRRRFPIRAPKPVGFVPCDSCFVSDGDSGDGNSGDGNSGNQPQLAEGESPSTSQVPGSSLIPVAGPYWEQPTWSQCVTGGLGSAQSFLSGRAADASDYVTALAGSAAIALAPARHGPLVMRAGAFVGRTVGLISGLGMPGAGLAGAKVGVAVGTGMFIGAAATTAAGAGYAAGTMFYCGIR